MPDSVGRSCTGLLDLLLTKAEAVESNPGSAWDRKQQLDSHPGCREGVGREQPHSRIVQYVFSAFLGVHTTFKCAGGGAHPVEASTIP